MKEDARVSRSCVERGLHGAEDFRLRPHPGNWALSFLLGGACILGAISRCPQPRAVYNHLPSRILWRVVLCDILHPHLNRQCCELRAFSSSLIPHLPPSLLWTVLCSSVFPGLTAPKTHFKAHLLLLAFLHSSSPQGTLSFTLFQSLYQLIGALPGA